MGGKYPKQIKGFYECVRKILYACRLAGFLPISGLLNRHSEFSRCTWSSYSLYYALSLLFMVVRGIIKLKINQSPRDHFKELGMFLRQSIAFVAALFLLKFALNWRKMISKIETNERLLPPLKNPERASRSSKRIIALVFAVDIAKYLVKLLLNIRMFVLCSNDYDYSVKSYFMHKYKWFKEEMPFTYGLGVLVEYFKDGTDFISRLSRANLILHTKISRLATHEPHLCYYNDLYLKLQSLFLYNFVDILVLTVTLYLIYRFRNFNRLMRLRQSSCAKTSYTRWSDLQAHYTRLARLVKIIDDHVNPFIFLSFLSNLIFICKTIYDVIQKQKKQLSHHNLDNICITAQSSDWVSVLDTFTNITHLFIKTTLVSGLTAHLHTLSRKPLDALHTIPETAYNLEMQRFMDQVYHSRISLSGYGMFNVSRGTILSMLSTIITYELVLLQMPADRIYIF